MGCLKVFIVQVNIVLIKEIWFTIGCNLFRISLNMSELMLIFIVTEYAMLVNY